MKLTFGKLVNLIVIIVLLQASAFSVFAAGTVPTRPTPKTPDSQPAVVGDNPTTPAARPEINKLSKDLLGLTDATPVHVSIRGTMASMAQVAKTLDDAGRLAYAEQVKSFQTELEKGIVANGGQVLFRFRTLSSGVLASIPGNKMIDVARLPGVEHISRPVDYQVDLSETVGFIGGDTLKSFGLKGKGVKIAILDSGLDYTHLAFGGYANPAAWEAAYYGSDPACYYGDEPICPNRNAVSPEWADLFGPNALRVKGGFDWVGPDWPTYSSVIQPDPNPIALADTGTHGTHVADIIGGLGYPAGSYDTQAGPVSYPALGEGMAPEADLYAFTVCSAVATSCSGDAMLLGMDDAADLDDNPATIDPADVLNMSLGSNYGQPEDDSTWMSNELVKYGTIVVQSAGNGGDKPYIVGSPSIANGSISVAQTSVPSARQFRVIVDSPAGIAGDLTNQLIAFTSEFYTTKISAEVVYDNTNADTRRGCQADGVTPPAAWSGDGTRFAGKILLVNRGTCAASYKVANGQANGAVMVLIAMITAGAPVDFSYGGGTLSIPAFTITLADGNKLKSTITAPMPAGINTLATVTADPSVYISLADTIATTSSRGPRQHDNMIKPDVGAPGASVSAIAGTGSQIAAFGGTSGAAPMVTGSMALLKDLFKDAQNFVDPNLSVAQYKALLMNSANPYIYENRTPANPEGTLLPVARIGAGQVDLTHALKTKILSYDVTNPDPLEWTGSMSFQYVAAAETTEIKRTVRVLNLNPFEKKLVAGYEFRYDKDYSGAITLSVNHPTLTIPAGEYRDVEVTMTIDPTLLTSWFDWENGWTVDRGYWGGDGQNFKQVEYDGYFWIGEAIATTIEKETSMPFLVVAKPVADVTAGLTEDYMGGTIDLANAGAVASHTDLFNLVDESPNYWEYKVGDCTSIGSLPGCNSTPIDLKDIGYRMWLGTNSLGAPTYYVDFAISIWDNPYRAGTTWPVGLEVDIDTIHPAPAGSAAAIPGPDGIDDYAVYMTENGGFGASGQGLVTVQNLSTGGTAAYFYLDSTFDSNNYILTVPAAAIGLSPLLPTQAPDAIAGTKMNFSVLAYDSYFTGNVSDFSPELPNGSLGTHKVDVAASRWSIDDADQVQTIDPAATVNVEYTLGAPLDWLASGSQIGFLAMYREAPIQKESKALVLSNHVVTNLLFIPILYDKGSDPYGK